MNLEKRAPGPSRTYARSPPSQHRIWRPINATELDTDMTRTSHAV